VEFLSCGVGIGSTLHLGSGDTFETVTVKGFGSIILEEPLKHDHPAGESLQLPPSPPQPPPTPLPPPPPATMSPPLALDADPAPAFPVAALVLIIIGVLLLLLCLVGFVVHKNPNCREMLQTKVRLRHDKPDAKPAAGSDGVMDVVELPKGAVEAPHDAAIEQAVAVREGAELEMAINGRDTAEQQAASLEKQVQELAAAGDDGESASAELKTAQEAYETARSKCDELERALQERIKDQEQLSVAVEELRKGNSKPKPSPPPSPPSRDISALRASPALRV